LRRIGSILVVLAMLAPVPAAAEVAVDLELVFAVDISGSIDPEEAELQRAGYVQALLDPNVLRTIQAGRVGRIAVSYMEWAGAHQAVVAGWGLIEDAASARAFAERLAQAPIMTEMWTSISGAVSFALPLFAGNGFAGLRRVIDISGDGPNNAGEFVTRARDRALRAGVTINGLPIMNGRPSPYGWPAYEDLDLYYVNCVIGGPGAFIVVADTFQDFARAIRRKMILEIAGRRPPERRRLVTAKMREAPACDIGERRRDLFLEDDY
jgi:hypothetical protein